MCYFQLCSEDYHWWWRCVPFSSACLASSICIFSLCSLFGRQPDGRSAPTQSVLHVWHQRPVPVPLRRVLPAYSGPHRQGLDLKRSHGREGRVKWRAQKSACFARSNIFAPALSPLAPHRQATVVSAALFFGYMFILSYAFFVLTGAGPWASPERSYLS